MNITPVNFASQRLQNFKPAAAPSFGSEMDEFYAGEEKPKNEGDLPKTNLKDFVGTAKQYVKPFLAGVVLTFAAQALYNNNEKSELKQQIYTERAIANSGVREMVKSIADDLKDIEKVDSVEMKNVMGGFSKELIINKDGQRIIYDADTKARYEDLGGDHYARTRFGVVTE